jgi:putative redox protein
MSGDAGPTVVVRDGGPGVFDTRGNAGRHELVVDEPVGSGGRDAGPSPYDLLLAALGSCTVMTMRLYAQRRGYPLAGVTVALSHDRVHARDCAECDTDDGRLDRIRRTITMSGELSRDQRADLLRVADRCPVHRTLSSDILIETFAAVVTDDTGEDTS